MENQHFQAGSCSVHGRRMGWGSGFPSCRGSSHVSPCADVMSRGACPQWWLCLQLRHKQERTEGPLSQFGDDALGLAFCGCPLGVPSTHSSCCCGPVAAAKGEEEEEGKRRSVAGVETGELLREPSLQGVFGYLQHLGASAGAGGAGPRLPRLSFQHPNSFCGR